MNNDIKVGFCVAYDWPLLRNSIPLIYDHADRICLSLDKEHISWAGNEFEFDNSAFNYLVNKLDVHKKIKIFENNFHLPGLLPMENEIRQRKMMSDFMGQGGWHLQLDCDEYFINFKGFAKKLKNLKLFRLHETNICCPWITLIKKNDQGYFIVSESEKEKLQYIPIASTNPKYEYGRVNGYFNFLTNFIIIHHSWAHSEDEVMRKLKNWGHFPDLDGNKYFELWRSLDESNFNQYHNFHPLVPGNWPGIKFIPAKDIEDLFRYYKLNPITVNKFWLWMQNSRVLSKIRSLIHR